MNVCIFSGRLTKDAETRYTQSGKCVCSFGLAVDTGFGDNKKTVFLNCSVWNKEALAQYLTKGKPVIVHGEYTEREWQDKDGNNRKAAEIIVREIEFQQGQPKGDNQGGADQPQGAPRQQPAARGNAPRQQHRPVDDDLGQAFPSAPNNDDVPF